jgi:squalene-associated FAD-dependent desaturase
MRVCVIGAGLAGLSAGCELADTGVQVTLLERRPWAGGKTYSFEDRETGERIDNGQHVLMRCTTAHGAFLRKLGTAHLVHWQRRLRVPVLDADGKRSDLAAAALPAPLHLAPSFLRYAHLRVGDKLRIGRAIAAMRADAGSNTESFGDWLRRHGQSAGAIDGFWELIVVPALNCRCDDVSSAQALFVFREGFLKSAEAAAIGVPAAGLSDLHVEPAVEYVEARGGELRTGATVRALVVRDLRVAEAVLEDGKRIEADAWICALPPRQLLDVLPAKWRRPAPFGDLAAIRTSPIVNLHLWFDGPIIDRDFVAFTGCDLQWLFQPRDGDGHVVLSLSAAERYMPLDKGELTELLLPQLRRAVSRAASRTLLRATAIKEPDATFVPAPVLRRPGPETPIANLFLAGAYTDTGWPATMESAVRSGVAAAAALARRRGSIETRAVAASVA